MCDSAYFKTSLLRFFFTWVEKITMDTWVLLMKWLNYLETWFSRYLCWHRKAHPALDTWLSCLEVANSIPRQGHAGGHQLVFLPPINVSLFLSPKQQEKHTSPVVGEWVGWLNVCVLDSAKGNVFHLFVVLWGMFCFLYYRQRSFTLWTCIFLKLVLVEFRRDKLYICSLLKNIFGKTSILRVGKALQAVLSHPISHHTAFWRGCLVEVGKASLPQLEWEAHGRSLGGDLLSQLPTHEGEEWSYWWMSTQQLP